MFSLFGPTTKKKRAGAPLDAEWRFKPAGRIASPWSKVVLDDLSRTSGTITCDRSLAPGEAIDVRTVLDGRRLRVFDATVVSCDRAGSRFKAAMSFRRADDASSHALARFINKRLTGLRGRGAV